MKIGLVQINNSFSGQGFLPYSVGLLQSYAQKYIGDDGQLEFLKPIYKRISQQEAAVNLDGADIVFFSVYVWNLQASLDIAEYIKSNNPGILVVFGGPEVPQINTEGFLRRHGFIDIACHGEGENIFLSILLNYKSRDWNKVDSISYFDQAGKFVQTPPADRISDLKRIPSPYIDNIFEPLMGSDPDQDWIALWETNRGCPFSCSYCVWGSDTQNRVYEHDIEKLYEEIDWFSRKKIEFVLCCDANFGILDRDVDIVNYFAKNKKRYGYPKALSVQSTKNFTENTYEIYRKMSEAGLSKGVSLAFQSLNADTLKYIKRKNIPITSFNKTQLRLTSMGIETFSDLILGLPAETYDSFADGVSAIIKNGQHNRIQFNNLSILTNSEMDNPPYQKEFGLDVIKTQLINIHGSLDIAEQTQESQRLVVGTASMPRGDWVKARAYGWMAALLHFDKLLQVPFVILSRQYSVEFRKLIELFMANKAFSILSEISSFFIEKAVDIQNGGPEFCKSEKWLNIWWPADELVFIKLCAELKLDDFYSQAEKLIGDYLHSRECVGYSGILTDSIALNRNLIKLPFKNTDVDVNLSFNIWDVYYGALRGEDVNIQKGYFCYRIDRTTHKWGSWDDWCREVIWYQHKKGAYIYNCRSLCQQGVK